VNGACMSRKPLFVHDAAVVILLTGRRPARLIGHGRRQGPSRPALTLSPALPVARAARES